MVKKINKIIKTKKDVQAITILSSADAFKRTKPMNKMLKEKLKRSSASKTLIYSHYLYLNLRMKTLKYGEKHSIVFMMELLKNKTRRLKRSLS